MCGGCCAIPAIGPGGLALIGLGVLTVPIWGPFAAVGYGGYVAVVATKYAHERNVPKVQEFHRNVYDFLNPDALHVKINDFTMRLKFDTTNPVIRTRRGELYLLKGDLIHAENDFQAALSNTNNVDPEAHFYSAIVKTSIGKHREAIEHYSLAIKNINSRSVLSENAKKVDDFANSFESMRRSVKQTGDSFRVGLTNIFGVNDYLHLNTKFVQEQQTIDTLERALNKKIQLCDIYFNRALVHMYLYEYDSAIDDLLVTIEMAKEKSQRANLPQYVFALSVAYYYEGLLEESLIQITKAIDIAQHEFKQTFEAVVPRYLVQRACVYDRLFKTKEAQIDREQVEKLQPGMLSTPFHIRLLHDDVVSNIVSFLDKRTVLSVALSCRQLYAVYKSGELDNPMLYRTQYELTAIVDLNGDFTKDSFLRLNADQLQQVLKKRFTKRIDSFKTIQEIELGLEQRKKELFAWRDHNPDNRYTSCEKILKYFEEYDKRTDYKVYGVPDSIHNLLKKSQLELGLLLCRKWSEHGDSDIFNAVKDQGPLLVLFIVGTAIMAGYISKSVTIDKTHIEDHGAWLYNGNTDTVHPVAHAERAFAVSGGYIKFGGPSFDDQYNVDYSFCSMGCAYNTFICDSDDVYVDWKAPSEYNSCACGYGVFSVKSLSV